MHVALLGNFSRCIKRAYVFICCSTLHGDAGTIRGASLHAGTIQGREQIKAGTIQGNTVCMSS